MSREELVLDELRKLSYPLEVGDVIVLPEGRYRGESILTKARPHYVYSIKEALSENDSTAIITLPMTTASDDSCYFPIVRFDAGVNNGPTVSFIELCHRRVLVEGDFVHFRTSTRLSKKLQNMIHKAMIATMDIDGDIHKNDLIFGDLEISNYCMDIFNAVNAGCISSFDKSSDPGNITHYMGGILNIFKYKSIQKQSVVQNRPDIVAEQYASPWIPITAEKNIPDNIIVTCSELSNRLTDVEYDIIRNFILTDPSQLTNDITKSDRLINVINKHKLTLKDIVNEAHYLNKSTEDVGNKIYYRIHRRTLSIAKTYGVETFVDIPSLTVDNWRDRKYAARKRKDNVSIKVNQYVQLSTSELSKINSWIKSNKNSTRVAVKHVSVYQCIRRYKLTPEQVASQLDNISVDRLKYRVSELIDVLANFYNSKEYGLNKLNNWE